MSVKSSDIPAPKSGLASVFLRSQFLSKPRRPPKSTDFTGKVAMVTGASTGLGFHCCKHLLDHNISHLILAVRSVNRGEAAAAKLRREHPGVAAKVDVWELEMGSYKSVQAFAQRAAAELPRLDMAVLNAGKISVDFEINESTGHEQTIQVNYLSTILLAILLLPVFRKTKRYPGDSPGGLSIVNSGMSYAAKLDNRDEVPLLKSFDVKPKVWNIAAQTERYSASKLLAHLCLPSLVENVNSDEVVVNLVDPGLCKGTELHRDGKGMPLVFMELLKTMTGRTLELGSTTYVDAVAVKGKESHGCYIMDWSIKP